MIYDHATTAPARKPITSTTNSFGADHEQRIKGRYNNPFATYSAEVCIHVAGSVVIFVLTEKIGGECYPRR